MVKSQPPHIRKGGSVPWRMWTTVAALSPVSLTYLIAFGFQGLRILTVTVTTAVLSELLIEKILKKEIKIYDGSAVITGTLLALFLPPTLPSWGAALGAFTAIFLGREVFGGLGSYPLHPALAGFFFLTLGPFEAFFWKPPQTYHFFAVLTILLGGLLLLTRRIIRWEIPLLYLGTFFLFGAGRVPFFSAPIFLAAFFLVTDPVTTPMSRAGERWSSFGSGAVTAFLFLWFPPAVAVATAVILMNALTPALDEWNLPGRRR